MGQCLFYLGSPTPYGAPHTTLKLRPKKGMGEERPPPEDVERGEGTSPPAREAAWTAPAAPARAATMSLLEMIQRKSQEDRISDPFMTYNQTKG